METRLDTCAPVLELRDIRVDFARPFSARTAARWLLRRADSPRLPPVRAVDGVSIDVRAGEIVALVGESGCGKSTLGRVAVGLQRASAGQRFMRGEALDGLRGRQALARQLKLQMVFQDPFASLNPRLRVVDIVGEAAVTHGIVDARERAAFVADLLRQVGLDPTLASRYPHQFSGGQRARIGIARALSVKPDFIVCDEAVAALDVSVQSQVLNLFADLRERFGLSYLFVSHNLAVVRHVADRVAVMYLGRIVESGTATELFRAPLHPYTQALLAEQPTLKVRKKRYVAIQGEIPSPLAPPSGCHFHPRCVHAAVRCREEVPRMTAQGGRQVACHLYGP